MNEALTQMRDLAVSLMSFRAYAMSDAELRDSVDTLRSIGSSVSACIAALTAEASGRQLPQSLGYSSTNSWLRHEHRLSRAEAAAASRLGAFLAARPELERADAGGTISAEQALVIGEAVASLAGRVEPAIVDAAEKRLVADAEAFDPASLRVLADRVLAHVAPEIAEGELQRKLAEAERRAYADRGLTLSIDRVTQQTRVTGKLTAEMGAILAAALAPLARRRARSASNSAAYGAAYGAAPDGMASSSAGLDGALNAVSVGAESERPDLFDERTPAQRRADALIELCDMAYGRCRSAGPSRDADYASFGGQDDQADPANASDLAAPAAPAAPVSRFHVNVTVDYDVLRQELGAGFLDSGQMVTPESVRRMGCDARILPAVLGGAGQVLDLGRGQRIWSGAPRRAVIMRDRGCVFPACDRPPERSDIHHIRYWSRGGRTDLNNAALLCPFHHHLIHHSDWTLRMGSDGLPEIIPPLYVDPLRRPLRNTHHLRC